MVDVNLAATLTAPPVAYLRALPLYGVILCTEHRSCYTVQNLRRHLTEKHAVKPRLWKEIETWIDTQNIAAAVSQPVDYIPLIPRLAHVKGFVCASIDCHYRTASEQNIQRHCSKQHAIASWQKQREQRAYSTTTLQFLFAKTPEYFIVESTSATPPSATSLMLPTPTTPLPGSGQSTPIRHDQSISSALSLRVREAAEEQKERYRQLGEPHHVSEITPWLRKSRFHHHLAGIKGSLIVSACQVPRSLSDDARLYLIVLAGERVIRKAYELVEKLYHVDARTLNTFQVGVLTQDPFQGLQNAQSLSNYVKAFQSLLCYFIRVADNYLEREMFVVTQEQREALDKTLGIAEKLDDAMPKKTSRANTGNDANEDDNNVEDDNDDNHDDVEGRSQTLQAELDQSVLRLCLALVQQRIKRTYDSAVASFCAARSTDLNPEDETITWKFEGEVSGLLSKLIYCSQLLILQNAEDLVSEGAHEDFGDALESLCRQWILSKSRSPVSTLNDWRLYSMKVASSMVPPAPIMWDDDGQTLTFRDIRYSIPDLAEEISFCLGEAQRIFREELCLGFDDIPTYPLGELQDNWACKYPGYSFVDDSRNAAYFEGHADWLSQRIAQHSDLRDIVFHTEQTEHAPGRWPVRSEFAKQFHISAEKFIEFLVVPGHKGSGQPAHRTEFTGILWRNSSLAPRNVRLHSGYLIFVLTYYKSQSRTHGSRSPVRVFFPALAQLLVQYLALIQPFRVLLSRDTGIPPVVGDFLWSLGEKPLPEEHMTRILVSMSRRSLGRKVNPQAWRQMCVGIAVKKFSGMGYEADIDIPGNDDDHELDERIITDGITLPASFHAQAVHTVRTGNRAYGGSINFSSSLTDAGLQVYLWTSKLWWTLFERQVQGNLSGKRARPLSTSETPSSSLVKRVAHRIRAPRQLRQWGSETVLIALKRLFCRPDAQFRSPIQQHMVEEVAAGHAEVVVVLATAGGKSLSFLVPTCLPQAGTTVVVVPLVALKSDLVRRCWDADIQYSIWASHGDHERYTGTPLLFVSAEQAAKQPFRTFLSQLDANRQLDRIVFDECHLILTASEYRPKMALLRFLRELRCQVVFLSATLPPLLMTRFYSRMLLDQPQIIRDITFRRDLFYDFHRQSQAGNFEEYMEQGISRQLQSLAHDDQARIIVYVNRKEDAQTMAARLGCEYYYSDSGTVAEKEQVVARWRNGDHRVIMATSAFGTGVDYAHVRCVIHQGLPTDAINFAQEVGRLGRDGHGGSSFIIVPRTLMPIGDATWKKEQWTTALTQRVMQRYVSQSRCLWATLSRFVDGAERMQYCREEDGRQLCGVCQVYGRFVGGQEVDYTRYWDVDVQNVMRESVDKEDVENEHDEDKGEDDHGEDENEDEDRRNMLLGGSQRLRASERAAEDGQARYLEGCRRWRGICLICQLVRGGRGMDHTLDQCTHREKWKFIGAKKAMVPEGGGRRWMKEHVGCWACGQPPTICDGKKGVRGCEFRDMVFPGAWAMFHMGNMWGESLASVSGQRGGFESEEAWMKWLGTECEVFGERGIQGVRMLAWLLARMEEGELGER